MKFEWVEEKVRKSSNGELLKGRYESRVEGRQGFK